MLITPCRRMGWYKGTMIARLSMGLWYNVTRFCFALAPNRAHEANISRLGLKNLMYAAYVQYVLSFAAGIRYLSKIKHHTSTTIRDVSKSLV